ncbi:restriction endonuclease subunit S [Hoylesella nanceiensis]|uniref:restriction endonuclease subunit S n=1 Tax=Hoylesella nanceiensis TaxID=425941 RepID=UPI001CAE239A|nr:restriction endonuclease subunit S [Hoylesella nanceiensis]MBF1428876.1 restriction endonuclease subunit S [Hoylesella nanceiensis]
MKKYKLGDCLSMIKNGAIIKQAKGAKGYPITRIETLSNNFFNRDRLGYADIFDITPYKDYILESGDLIMSHINSRQFLGRTVLYNKLKDEIIIHGMNVLRIKTCPELLDPIYAYYLFKTEYFRKNIDNIRKDAINQSSISISDINNIILELPVISLQKSTVSILSSIDRKIELNRSINHNLEAMAKQLYDYWFLQFDFPDENGKPYKSSGGKMIWNKKLKREIPEGWEVDNICKIAHILSGGTPSKTVFRYWKNGIIPFFSPTDCNGNIFQIETADHITQEGLEHCASSLFDEGTIFITARGSIGKLVIVGSPMAMNQSCYALLSKKDEYQYLYFLTFQLIECLKIKGSGSVFKSITISDIEKSLLCIANNEIITAFCKLVSPSLQKIKNNLIEIKQLTKLRDSLLPLLMNGQASPQNCD